MRFAISWPAASRPTFTAPTGGGVRLRNADAEAAELRRVDQRGQGGRASPGGEGHRVVAGSLPPNVLSSRARARERNINARKALPDEYSQRAWMRQTLGCGSRIHLNKFL